MKILIIGGTKFLGRHLTQAALKNNHEVTLFNRGKKYANEDIENVEQIHGDRNSDLDKLSGRSWDAVIDTCGYLPQVVQASAKFFSDKAGQYVFISSGSVYSETSVPNYDESTATSALTAEQKEAVEKIDPKGDITAATLGENYGASKYLCEASAETEMPNRVLNVRAGMIVGSFDPTDRFTYWVMRVAEGGEVLAPGTPGNYVQLIDVRDLSEWIIRMIERNKNGVFNATGKPFEITFEKMLDEIKDAVEAQADFVWAGEKFLKENNIAPWSQMPFYLPESDESSRNFLTMNIDKALEENLKFRPLRETILDVLNWRRSQDFEMRAGISAAGEKELLNKLHKL